VEYASGRLLVKSTRRWRALGPSSDVGAVDVEVRLPAGSQVSGHSDLGGFVTEGPLGDARLKSGLGDIQVEDARTVALSTGAGTISVEHATGDAELKTGSGAIRAGEIDGAATIKNSNGDTRVAEVAGDLRVKAANGDIAVGRSHSGLTAKTANGDIRVGAGRGSVVAETARGSVEIGVPEGTAAWMDINTGFGHFNNALDAAGPPGPGEDTVEVRARSGYGDITVRRATTATATEGAER
jgi:DUF4097 and DUF4098 domain-containing protein YvlB